MFLMPRTRNPYPTEFREHIIALARSGRSVESLAREFEPCAATIHLWLKEAQQDSGERDDGVTSAEREELKRLRRENKVLRQERDILSKAAAWFAQGEIPSSRSSGS
jgi:transposase